MTYVPQINRRAFVVNAAAFGGGLALGTDFPLRSNVVRAAESAPEVTAWVVIKPDDSVVIRIARSEMGQGSMTGLAQLVAEELECDWSKVSTEFPTPGENLARNRVWGSQFTAGSRAIRESNEYLRKAGATARTMLLAAAANEWQVPASECSASALRPHHTLRQGCRSRRQDRATEGRGAQGSQGLEDCRQAAQTPRYRAQGHW
jgi:isoquinoline 1-oxidoreductase subunit beta